MWICIMNMDNDSFFIDNEVNQLCVIKYVSSHCNIGTQSVCHYLALLLMQWLSVHCMCMCHILTVCAVTTAAANQHLITYIMKWHLWCWLSWLWIHKVHIIIHDSNCILLMTFFFNNTGAVSELYFGKAFLLLNGC